MKIKKQYSGLLRLGLLILIVPLAAWMFALRGTFGLWNNYRENRLQIDTLSNNKTNTHFQEKHPLATLAETIASLKNVNIIIFNRLTAESESNTQLFSNELHLSGTYDDLIRALFALEKVPNIRVASTAFELQQEPNKKSNKLVMRLLIYELTKNGSL